MSEAAGIAVLWWYLWCWWRAMERRTWLSAILALFLFGVLMGVRLSFVPFGLSLVWLLGVRCADWRYEGKRLLPRVTGFVLLAGGFQLLWVAGLALSEGGFVGFAELAAAFTEGHFSQWGGGVISAASVPLAERALRFAGDNLLWTGMFARTTAAACGGGGAAARRRASRGGEQRPARQRGQRLAPRAPAAAWLRRPALPGALALLAGAYGAWALLAQNIDKPRHITPLIGLMWLLLLALFRAAPPARLPAQAPPSAASPARLPAQAPPSAASATAHPAQASPSAAPAHPRALRTRRALQVAGALLAACVVTLQAIQGGRLAAQQASERPAVYQLADAFRSQAAGGKAGSVVLYTWEETRVLDYLHTPVLQRRIETYNYFIADIKANPAATILLTDHVLRGFEMQVGSLQAKVKPVAHYESQSLFDPVYNQITVYEWKR